MSNPKTITLHDILEKMIMEDQSGLDTMMHEYMVQRFQLAHERLLQEEDEELREYTLDETGDEDEGVKKDHDEIDGDEQGGDEFFGDGELEDGGEEEPDGDEGMGGPGDGDGDEGMGGEMGGGENDGEVDKADLQAALARIEQEFEDLMSQVDSGEIGGMGGDTGGEETDLGDMGGEGGLGGEEEPQDFGESVNEGEMPPWLKKGKDKDDDKDDKKDDKKKDKKDDKKDDKKKDKKDDDDDDKKEKVDEDFADLEESLDWSFLKASEPSLEGDKQIGDKGGSIKVNDKSPVVSKKIGDRMGGTPIQIRSDEYKGYEWKDMAGSQKMKPARNTLGSDKNLYSDVKNPLPSKEGTLVGAPGAGKITPNTKSPVLQAKSVTESKKGKK